MDATNTFRVGESRDSTPSAPNGIDNASLAMSWCSDFFRPNNEVDTSGDWGFSNSGPTTFFIPTPFIQTPVVESVPGLGQWNSSLHSSFLPGLGFGWDDVM